MNPDAKLDLSLPRLASVIVKLAFAAVFSLALSQIVLILNGLPQDPIPHALGTVFFLSLLALLTWQRYSLALTGLLLTLMSLFGLFFHESVRESFLQRQPELMTFVNWAHRWLWGMRDADGVFEARLAFLFVGVIALLSYLFIARFNRPGLALAAWVSVVALLGDPFTAGRLPWLIAAAVVVLTAFARKQRRSFKILARRRHQLQSWFMLQALPVALATVLLASFLTPLMSTDTFRHEGLNQTIDRIGHRFSGPFSGRAPQRFLGLGQSGYHPLPDRLGGPVTLSDAPVFQVDGHAGSMRLRGRVLHRYDGARWHADPEADLRPLSDLDSSQARDALGLGYFATSESVTDREVLFEAIDYRILPRYRPMNSVLLAGPMHALRIDSGPSAFLFDRNGEVYTRESVQEDDAMLLQVQRMRIEDDSFAAQIHWLEERDLPPVSSDDPSRFLQMPETDDYQPGGTVHDLAESLLMERSSDYEQALAVREFLRGFGRYELDVEVPPIDQDFVSHFMETGEGYCVYYATALTMLLRLQGIPARYVEGYFAPQSQAEDGLRTITGENAHAWTEVYVSAIGWIPIDATPSGNVFDTPPEERETPPDATPTLPPLPDLTPSPSPDETMTDTDIEEDPDESPSGSGLYIEPRIFAYLLLILLLTAYVLRAAFVYRKRQSLSWMQQTLRDPGKLVTWYRRQLASLLSDLKLKKKDSESLRGYFTRLQSESDWFAGREKLVEDLVFGLELALYGDRPPAQENLAALAQAYRLLLEIVRQNQNPVWFTLKHVLRPQALLWRF